MKKTILVLIISVLIFSCTTAVERPKLTGTIVDEYGIPVDSCAVARHFGADETENL